MITSPLKEISRKYQSSWEGTNQLEGCLNLKIPSMSSQNLEGIGLVVYVSSIINQPVQHCKMSSSFYDTNLYINCLNSSQK